MDDEQQQPCRHPRAAHLHGTRAAYVADRCRCPCCREANRLAGRRRTKDIASGRWNPYVDAEPARAYVAMLRSAGIGIDRIIELSGVGSGTVRHLVYRREHDRTDARIRRETEIALLAVQVGDSSRAGHCLVDAQRTRHRIQTLKAAGWSIRDLAEALGRPPSSLAATLRRDRVTIATATAVRSLYAARRPSMPPGTTSSEVARAGTTIRRPGRSRMTRPPAASTRIDRVPDLGQSATTPDPDGLDGMDMDERHGRDDIDEVAVERAMTGARVPLREAELRAAVRRLTLQGLSIRQTAERLHTSPRTVSRRRHGSP